MPEDTSDTESALISNEWRAFTTGAVRDVFRGAWVNDPDRDALAGNELTITENYPGSDGGPAGGGVCTSPLEPNVATASIAPSTRQALPDTAPGETSAARTVTLTNSGGAPMTVSAPSRWWAATRCCASRAR